MCNMYEMYVFLSVCNVFLTKTSNLYISTKNKDNDTNPLGYDLSEIFPQPPLADRRIVENAWGSENPLYIPLTVIPGYDTPNQTKSFLSQEPFIFISKSLKIYTPLLAIQDKI